MNRVFELEPKVTDATNYYYFEQGFSNEELSKIEKDTSESFLTLNLLMYQHLHLGLMMVVIQEVQEKNGYLKILIGGGYMKN